jgi:hypothetical protein
MKSLTKISTAALMGLLAVALSSSVFAGPGRGGATGNFGSINQFNDCSVNEDLQALIVKTTISDDSDDTPGIVAELGDITVQGRQKAKGPWQNLGAPKVMQAILGDNYTMIPLCDGDLDPKANVLDAEVETEVLNAKPGKTNSGRCDDNPLTYCVDEDGNPYVCEEFDESIVDVPEGLCD